MGLEAACTVRVGRKSSRGKALLEGEVLAFRGVTPERGGAEMRLDIRFDEMRDVGVDGESLVVRTDEREARFELSESVAERWARLIKEPKDLFEKLELGPDAKVAVVDVHDPIFLTALRERTAGVVEGRVPQGASTIFFGVETREALRKLPLLRARIADSGAIWVIRPKGANGANGANGVAESDVFAALRDAGLVDTKVVALSRTHTAHKSVVPVELRGQGLRRRPPIVSQPPGPPDAPALTGLTGKVKVNVNANAKNDADVTLPLPLPLPAKKKAARAKVR